MEDKLHDFFSENDFDFHEPKLGHEKRFEKRLNKPAQNHKKPTWKWLSIAASVVLVFGFWMGNNYQKQQLDLADVSRKMEEVQNYFVSTIHQELKTIEKNRNLETETVIEEALEQLEELEDDYKSFMTELNNSSNSKLIINAMIKNYQKRLEILENVLNRIEQIKNTKTLNNEIYL